MSYKLDVLDNGHIIVLTVGKDFDLVDGMRQVAQECLPLLEDGPEPIILISDSRSVSINNLGDLITGANSSRQPEAVRVIRHPKVKKLLSVVNNRVIQAAVRGLNSATFGHIEMPVFETLEEAIDYARRYLYGQSMVG